MEKNKVEELLDFLKEKREARERGEGDSFVDEKDRSIKCDICNVELTTANWHEGLEIEPNVMKVAVKHGFNPHDPRPAVRPGAGAADLWKEDREDRRRPHFQACEKCYKIVQSYTVG